MSRRMCETHRQVLQERLFIPELLSWTFTPSLPPGVSEQADVPQTPQHCSWTQHLTCLTFIQVFVIKSCPHTGSTTIKIYIKITIKRQYESDLSVNLSFRVWSDSCCLLSRKCPKSTT